MMQTARPIRTSLASHNWRNAEITAIFMNRTESNPAGYRPIGITSVVRDIIESITRVDIVDI